MSEVKPRKEIRCKPELWAKVEMLSKEKGLSFNKVAEMLLENGVKYDAMLELAKQEAERAMKLAITPVEKKNTVSYMGLYIDPDKIKL